MSESGGFTIDDAENDGLIKREVGTQLVANLKRSAPVIWQMFENVCENQDRRPVEVMGDHALRSINNQDHSEMLADVRVDMSDVNKDQIRIEDAKFIKTLTKELGLDTEQDDDPIEKLINRRLQAKAGPMIPGSDRVDSRELDEGVKKELNLLKERMMELQEEVSGSGVDSKDKDSQKEVDELFEDGEDGSSDDVAGEDTSDGEKTDENGDTVEGESVSIDEFLEEEDDSSDEFDELLEGDAEDGDGMDKEGGDEGEVLIEPDGINMEGDAQSAETVEDSADELVSSKDGVSDDE